MSILSPLAIRGILKTGDVLITGDHEFPRFSQTQFINDIDRIAAYMTEDDRAGFNGLMIVFGFLPNFMIRIIFKICDQQKHLPNFLGAPLRMIDIGVKGVVFTLYYSNLNDPQGLGKKILKNIRYDATINTVLSEKDDMQELINSSNPLRKELPLTQQTYRQVFDTAKEVQSELTNLSMKEKLACIARIKKIILQKQEFLIDVIQKETKKSRSDALFSEIFPILEHLDFLESSSSKALADESIHTPIVMLGKSSKVFYGPLGTILIISPWNYPLYQAIVPITCSFITGNATVYKPSEITPLTGVVEDILHEAGLKDSWVQIIYGDGAVGSKLIDERPNKIFFTGSVNTGKKIMAHASQYLIPVELELGGKDPMIVFEDVNIDRAVKGAVWGAFTNAGQSCTSVERLYVQESIYPEFKRKLVEETKRIKMKVDEDGDSDIGAMTSKQQVKIVAELVKDAVAQGSKILTGGEWDFQSEYIPPIIIEGSNHSMRINKEEIFGPVLPIMSFKTEAEAVQLANDSEYGLSASVWTKDKQRAIRVSRALETGNVSVNNVMLSEGNHALPFGGVKNSGIGRYKGVIGLHAFCNIKSILVDGDSNKIEANWYPYTAKKYKIFTQLTLSLFTGGLWGFLRFAISGLKLESYSGKVGRSGRPAVGKS